jgi:dihydrofolate reductase
MRNLIFAINITIDGCLDHTKGIADAELHDYFTNLMYSAGLLLYGRKTYELMVPFWPDVARDQNMARSENEFAQAFVAVNKVVVSRTLESVEGNTRIIRDNLQEEILKLKQEDGKDIFTGGVDLPSQLIKLGLVDEYYFVVHPVLGGAGRRLFEDAGLPDRLKLKLVESKVLKSGCVALHYLKQ